MDGAYSTVAFEHRHTIHLLPPPHENYLLVKQQQNKEIFLYFLDPHVNSEKSDLPLSGQLASVAEIQGAERFVHGFHPCVNRPILASDPLALSLCFQSLQMEVQSEFPQKSECIRLYVSLLLMEYLRLSISSPQNQFLSMDARIQYVIRYMLTNFRHPWRVEELSSLANVSPSYLNKLCRKQYGQSPIDMLIEKRMQLAQHLLSHPGTTVSNVCESIGFSDIYYFSRMFKKHCGLSPREYMRQCFSSMENQ